MKPGTIETLVALRGEVCTVLEDLGAIATHLREAIDFAQCDAAPSMDACIEDAANVAEDIITRLRALVLKCEEVRS